MKWNGFEFAISLSLPIHLNPSISDRWGTTQYWHNVLGRTSYSSKVPMTLGFRKICEVKCWPRLLSHLFVRNTWGIRRLLDLGTQFGHYSIIQVWCTPLILAAFDIRAVWIRWTTVYNWTYTQKTIQFLNRSLLLDFLVVGLFHVAYPEPGSEGASTGGRCDYLASVILACLC